MKIGDIVTRKSYNKDIIFKIVGFGIDNKNEKIAILKGVATGHDALTSRKGNITDLNNYRNSLNFIKAVKQARKWEPNLDNLVIFAGACQSNYEQLIRAGANYASSPGRIMIHALDPVFVVEKIACSRIDTIVPIEEVIEQTVTGLKGIGGSETRGKFRWAMPKSMLY